MQRVLAVLVLLLAGTGAVHDATAAAAAGELRFRQVEGADGVPLNVVEAGDPGKPGILLVHGIGQSYLSFENQLHSALAEEFHLVAFDLRGHGNSGKPWNREAYVDSAKWAGDVKRVMAATGLHEPVLLGWSYGSLVAADYLRHVGSKNLAGIALAGAFGGLTPPPKPAPPEIAEQMKRASEQQRSSDLEQNIAAARAFARRLTARPMPPEWIERATLIGMLLPGNAKGWMFERSFANQDLVPKIDVPLLLFVGKQDLSTPEDDARALAAAVPGARVSVYPEAGHSPFAEDPARFNQELAEFARHAFAESRRRANAALPKSPAGLPSGVAFRECADCPAMVVVPRGSFRMGFDGGEADRYEGPVRTVNIRRGFAAGRDEVTNAQYAAFVAATHRADATGCHVWVPAERTIKSAPGTSWRDPGYGRPPKDDEPVVCVSWNDAKAYVTWLREHTGKPYRLLSEAEWEYVARDGSASEFPWGEDPEQACAHANVYDASAADPTTPWPATHCSDGFAAVAPVGSFPANGFGLRDVIGNVWEWVEDCYVMPYPREPIDGSAQTAAGCDRHGVRGGSWRTDVRRQRPSFRGRDDPTLLSNIFGIRVARDLP